jgi:nitrogen-specific signal transduction histidine kinase
VPLPRSPTTQAACADRAATSSAETPLSRATLSGLDATVTVLGHGLRPSGVEVVREYAPDLPPVPARGSELTQVWTQLIGNALTRSTAPAGSRCAPGGKGTGWRWRSPTPGPGPRPSCSTGSSIPTSPPGRFGRGVGLGVDVARRIVVGLGGDLRVTSEPGNTVLAVRLPVSRQAQPS